jgi:hypothetical protein
MKSFSQTTTDQQFIQVLTTTMLPHHSITSELDKLGPTRLFKHSGLRNMFQEDTSTKPVQFGYRKKCIGVVSTGLSRKAKTLAVALSCTLVGRFSVLVMPPQPDKNESRNPKSLYASYAPLPDEYAGRWTQLGDEGLWDAVRSTTTKNSSRMLDNEVQSLLEESNLFTSAENQAHSVFAGKSILVIGGSTSRDLVGDFLQVVLPSHTRHNVSNAWRGSSSQGYQLFLGGKKERPFEETFNKKITIPLVDAGWAFTHLASDLPTSGCRDCKSSSTNLDYVATLNGGHEISSKGITYEYSWKPEIFSPLADNDGFLQRYCLRHYDVVYIGRGLHDAAYRPDGQLAEDQIRARFHKLASLLKCFPSTTLIILRTPYVTNHSPTEQKRVENVTSVLSEMVKDGVFDLEVNTSNTGESTRDKQEGSTRTVRSMLVNGQLLSSAAGHPVSRDGHHYDSRMAKSVWRVVFFACAAFFGQDSSTKSRVVWKDITAGKWKDCGL